MTQIVATGTSPERPIARRRALAVTGTAVAGLAGLVTGACAPPVPGGAISAAEVYVGLGKARQVAILDATSDRVIGRVQLKSFGDRGAPAQIGVGPGGEAAVLPLVSNSPTIALIGQNTSDLPPAVLGAAPRTPRRLEPRLRRTSWLRLGEEPQGPKRSSLAAPEAAQRLTTDARGRAYVVLGDGSGDTGPTLAVVDIATGDIRHRHQVGSAGEAVTALLADADGTRLYLAIWRWSDPSPFDPHGTTVARSTARGRLVSIDPQTGAVFATAALPPDAAVTDLAIAAGPAGSGRAGRPAVYANVQMPGPMRDEALTLSVDRTYKLVALDPEFMDALDTWSIDRSAGTFTVTPDGTRAYLLGGSGLFASPTRELISFDLTTGYMTKRWQLPDGCFALTLSSVGKLYVADALGDRLWRVDVARNVMLGDIPLPGAPLALATRPI